MSDTTPQVRVGDAERRVVDDRLMTAVGDGVLTLAEYDERSAVLWQCRTREELERLTADLPSEQPAVPVVPTSGPRPRRGLAPAQPGSRPGVEAAAPLPVQRSAAAPVPADGRPARRQRRGLVRRARRRFGGLLVPVAVLGAVLVAGPDSASVFGSSTTRVGQGDSSVQVSTLFGSVDVVVPDGAQVESSGLVLFGSNGCEGSACTATTGDVVEVRAFGAFGSVTVWTVSEWNARQDSVQELEERLEDQLDD